MTTTTMTELSYTPETRENTEAAIFLDVWGTGNEPSPFTFQHNGEPYTYKWSIDTAPDWLTESEGDAERDQCITVLTTMSTSNPVPPGYRITYQFDAGERECPDCEAKGVLPAEDYLVGKTCPLCEGDRYIYWGDEWQGIVFAPRYTYGSGMNGCLYDYGPHQTTSVDNAIDDLLSVFDNYFEVALEELGEETAAEFESRFRDDLRENGIHRFARKDLAGADYCEITDHGDGR